MWRRVAKYLLLVIGMLVMILGVHGMYVHFYDQTLFADKEAVLENPGHLFLVADVPDGIDGVVAWFSNMGITVWTVPFLFIILGVILQFVQSTIYIRKSAGGLFRRPADGALSCHVNDKVYLYRRRRYR